MKFNCGPTYREKIEAKEEWHRWFAWRPVRVGSHDCRWLEYVERRGTYHMCTGGAFWTFAYRALK